MSKPSRWVDINKFPENEQPALYEFAKQHNALSEDFDKMTGSTPDEKAATYAAMGKIRRVISTLHGHRFNTALISLQAYLLVSLLKQFGVKPEQMTQLFDLLLRFLQHAV